MSAEVLAAESRKDRLIHLIPPAAATCIGSESIGMVSWPVLSLPSADGQPM